MICNNCNNEYPDDQKICNNCGKPTNVKSEFSFKKFFNDCGDYFKSNSFSIFLLIMCAAAATTTLLFLICCGSTNTQSSLSWLYVIAAVILTAFTILRYDTTTMPMAIAYSVFMLPGLLDCIFSFRYIFFAPVPIIFSTIMNIIMYIVMIGILALIWLVTTKVIKNAPVIKLIIIFSSLTVCLYEFVCFLILLFTNFISALHTLAYIGFVGTYGAMMFMYDRKRIIGIFTGKNKNSAAAGFQGNVGTAGRGAAHIAPPINVTPVAYTAPSAQEVTPAGASDSSQSIFCSNCGKKLSPETAFCPGCGAKVNK